MTDAILYIIQRLKDDQRLHEWQYDALREIIGATWTFMSSDEYDEKLKRCEYLAARLQAIPDEIKALEAKLPCQAFIDKFGTNLWEFYKAKYPVNHHSELIEWLMSSDMVCYLIIEPGQFIGYGASTPPLEISFKRGEARFERWGMPDPSTWVRLAYAPEINTIYWKR